MSPLAAALPFDVLVPELTEINRLPSRPPLDPRPTADAARTDEPSPWRRSLDGRWRFLLVDQPNAAPEGWERSTYDDGSWDRLTVPGVWTRQGQSDLPIYTNVQMPWSGLEPPAVPDANPTGLHRSEFRVPRSWKGRDIVLHVGGAESVLLVWCNGSFVGMGKDSRLPSEFDLTAFVAVGTNQLALMVIRWSDATWIEDQDHWFHGGIHRSVHLDARGADRIDDLVVTADFDAAADRGILEVAALATGTAEGIRVQLETQRGRRIGRPVTAAFVRPTDDTASDRMLSAYAYPGPTATVRLDDLSVRAWSAERPTRYRVVTELLDGSGDVIEAHATATGFRRVEVRDRRLLVNGHPIVIHGVNRHDHHPVTGKTLTPAEVRDELVSMKRHNIDAIRTAHYPNDSRLLDLCDELGLYVVDEANCESHARLVSLSRDRRYHHAIVERVRRMVQRDRSHPCVIGWSLGNESGAGPAFPAAAAWVRSVDPTRFVHYEGLLTARDVTPGAGPGLRHEAPSVDERISSDVVAPMYAPVDAVASWAEWAERTALDDRPLVMCEFSHAMGNSNGSLTDYVDAFHRLPALAGGFVWDWRDQGLAETDADGRFFWAYGGHFGEEIHDGNFCINGLVGPDLHPHPGLREYQWAIRPVTTIHVEGRRLRVTNRRAFESTADLIATWTLRVDGEEVESGALDLDIPARKERTVTIPARTPARRGVETHLDVKWATRRRTPWAAAGHVVAWDQIDLTPEPVAARPPTGGTGPVIETNDAGLHTIRFGPGVVVDGDVTTTLWRAPTDNDGIASSVGGAASGVLAKWEAWGLDRLVAVLDELRTHPDGAITRRRRLVGPAHEAVHTTRVLVDDAAVVFHERLLVPEEWDDLPRVGVRFCVPAALDRLEWFGPGPHETYPDRLGAATVGRWSSTIEDQYHPFVKPQDHGVHVGTRWFSLTDRRGEGFSVFADRRFAFAARRHHDSNLGAANTVAELTPDSDVEVHVDAAVRGLGTGACGPDTLPIFRVAPGTWTWTWAIAGRGPNQRSPQASSASS